MKEETRLIASSAITSSLYGGMAGTVVSVVSGAAVVTTPVKFLGLITIGTTTAISLPVVVVGSILGAAAAGACGAYCKNHQIKKINRKFERLVQGRPDPISPVVRT